MSGVPYRQLNLHIGDNGLTEKNFTTELKTQIATNKDDIAALTEVVGDNATSASLTTLSNTRYYHQQYLKE